MPQENFPRDDAYTEARYDALSEKPVVPMARLEMTDRWREIGGGGRPEDLLTRGLCMACRNSGFLHKEVGGRLYFVQDATTDKLVRCFCEYGQKVDR